MVDAKANCYGVEMDIINLLIFLLVGAIAGWLAGLIVKGRGFGVAGNIVIGVIGAVVGGYLFGILGITTGGLLGAIVMATIGAAALLYVVGLLKKA